MGDYYIIKLHHKSKWNCWSMDLINTGNMKSIKRILVKFAGNEEDLWLWTSLMCLSMNCGDVCSKYGHET